MNTNVGNIYEVIEEIKENITDSQYKTVMDNLMVLNKKEEQTTNKRMTGLILDQIDFLYQYTASLKDADTKSQFSSRLELLKRTVFNLT